MGDTLVNVVLNSIDPGAIASVASAVGESPTRISASLKSIVPAILGGIAERKSDAGRLAMLTAMTVGARPGDAAGSFTVINDLLVSEQHERVADVGRQLLDGIFGGEGVGTLERAVAVATDMATPVVETLLPLVTPLVMASIGRVATKQGYSLDQLPAFLGPHKAALLGMLPRPVSMLVDSLSPPAMPLEEVHNPPTLRKAAPWLIAGVAAAAALVVVRLWAPSAATSSSEPPSVERVAGAPASPLAVRTMSAPIRTPTPRSLGLAEGPAADLTVALAGDGNQRILLERTSFLRNQSIAAETSEQELEEVAVVLRAFPSSRLEVVGHTDSSGTEDRNRQLSEGHALAVRDALVVRGIDPSRLTVRGLGGQEPIAPNDSPVGRAENRRIELVVVSR